MDNQRPFFILSFADLVADVVIEVSRLPVEPAAHQTVRHIVLEPGGAGNFLIAGQRLGLAMHCAAIIGSDAFGSEIINILRTEGVDVGGIQVQGQEATSTVIVLTDQNQQHVFLGKYGAGADIPLSGLWKKLIREADAVQFWGYSYLEERIRPALIEAVEYAGAQSCLIAFDPGPLFSNANDEYHRLFLSHSDIILLTEEEIPSLLGMGAGLEHAPHLLSLGPQIVCVKCGPKGCIVFRDQEQVSHPGYAVEVRDTSAAGDAFNAAFLYGVLHQWTLEQTAAFANAVGAAKVQKLGSGRSVPTKKEVINLLKKFHVEIPNFMGDAGA